MYLLLDIIFIFLMRKKKNKKYFKSNRKRPSKYINKSFNLYDSNKKVNIFKYSNSCVINCFEIKIYMI